MVSSAAVSLTTQLILLLVLLALPAIAEEPAEAIPPALSPYEPIYAVVGSRGPTTIKFQFSFKFRIFNPRGSAGKHVPWITQIHFGYSQISVWDVDADSSPFRDTSYKPSLFYLRDDQWKNTTGTVVLGFQTGLEHESNGKSDEDSRTLNTLYFQPILTFGDAADYHWRIAPKFYAYAGSLEDNPEIADYRGHVDLQIRWGQPDRWILDLLLRRGTEEHYGSIQFDASYPLSRAPYSTFEFLGHFQYFNGWGETLLDYNVKEQAQVRVGLMIVR